MKKMKYITLIFLLLSTTFVSAQMQEDMNTFNKERLNINKKGMAVLNIWSIGNIAWGAIGLFNSEGANRQFHSMNIIWNGINVALAGPAYFAARKGKYELTLRQTYKEQQKAEKIFLINAGLDIGYVMGGLYLTERSKNNTDKTRHDLNLGYGNSFMLQGGFLFLLDATLYTIHSRHGNKKLIGMLDKVTIGSSGVGYIHRF